MILINGPESKTPEPGMVSVYHSTKLYGNVPPVVETSILPSQGSVLTLLQEISVCVINVNSTGSGGTISYSKT